MGKILVINKCKDCYHLYNKPYTNVNMCSKFNIRIYNIYCIPAECKLKDADKFGDLKWLIIENE